MNLQNKQFTLETMNQNVLKSQYAVRGEMVIRAGELESKLKKGEKLPFDEVVYCNIGNPQQLNQKPITFFRQVISFLENTEMFKDQKIVERFPADVIETAKLLNENISGGVGAYSHSQGIPIIRKYVADFIERRDGFASDPEKIFLTDGASPAVQLVLKTMIRGAQDGVLIPIPQYPLYSACIPLLGGTQLEYFLDEEAGWGMNIEELDQVYEKSQKDGVIPRAIVVINPGNPTGQCLDVENMQKVVDFCKRRKMVLFADEVYQENIYKDSKKPFSSFKKVLKQMGKEYEDVELFSFHSISKGVTGECGQRGGYVEITGVEPRVLEQLYKMVSINLCPNVPGQVLMGLMVNPPKQGQPSYDLYKQEVDGIYDSLRRRAHKVVKMFNTLEGVSCNESEGALYAFPRFSLPKRAIEEANKLNKAPDLFYCISLLEETGVCVVPGSGFGQKEGTFHFRTTILPQEHKLDGVLERCEQFHKKFMDKYR